MRTCSSCNISKLRLNCYRFKIVSTAMLVVLADIIMLWGRKNMKKTGHIRTIVAGSLRKPLLTAECGSCQTSCQSACKTSCTVGNQTCGISKK